MALSLHEKAQSVHDLEDQKAGVSRFSEYGEEFGMHDINNVLFPVDFSLHCRGVAPFAPAAFR
jgi:hypothetical protein